MTNLLINSPVRIVALPTVVENHQTTSTEEKLNKLASMIFKAVSFLVNPVALLVKWVLSPVLYPVGCLVDRLNAYLKAQEEKEAEKEKIAAEESRENNIVTQKISLTPKKFTASDAIMHMKLLKKVKANYILSYPLFFPTCQEQTQGTVFSKKAIEELNQDLKYKNWYLDLVDKTFKALEMPTLNKEVIQFQKTVSNHLVKSLEDFGESDRSQIAQKLFKQKCSQLDMLRNEVILKPECRQIRA